MFGVIALCFTILRLSDLLGLSAEVGAFAAGLIVSSEPVFAEKALESVESLRDFFSAIFFASIGFHIYPTFLYHQGFFFFFFFFFLSFFTSYFSFFPF